VSALPLIDPGGVRPPKTVFPPVGPLASFSPSLFQIGLPPLPSVPPFPFLRQPLPGELQNSVCELRRFTLCPFSPTSKSQKAHSHFKRGHVRPPPDFHLLVTSFLHVLFNCISHSTPALPHLVLQERQLTSVVPSALFPGPLVADPPPE